MYSLRIQNILNDHIKGLDATLQPFFCSYGKLIDDFGSIHSGMTQYAYDANGNMTRDLNNGLTVMSYNRLNLPDELTCVGSDGVRSIRYLYASDGRKLRVSTSGPGGSSSVTDYASNVVYRDGSLDRILILGGYMTDGSYRFFMTDHLGSVRAVADSEGNVLEAYDYYPYGEDIAESASAVSPSAPGASLQPYRFNGKESQEFAGLPYLDYGARFYHQLSSRWTTMDPLAEKYYSVSPYAFCSNNPVNFVDWDGRMPFLLPVAPYVVSAVVSAVAAVGVVYAAYEGYNTLRDQSGWKNQQRRDRKAKEELDRAQLNVQNSIKENFPDPDNYDPNDGPEFRNNKKGLGLLLGILAFIESNSPLIKGMLSLESNDSESESDSGEVEGDTNGSDSSLDNSNDDIHDNDEENKTIYESVQ